MIYPRPKLTIFAEAAKTGEVIAYPDWARGWGITLEQTNSKPPMEWMNDALKQLNTHSLYLLQNGGYEWDKALEYPVGAKVQINNLIYIAKVKNTNINPANNTTTWQIYGLQESDLKEASEKQKGVVQLATDKEVKDSSVANKAVSPKTLSDNYLKLTGGTLIGNLTVNGVIVTSSPIRIQAVNYSGFAMENTGTSGIGKLWNIENGSGDLQFIARNAAGEKWTSLAVISPNGGLSVRGSSGDNNLTVHNTAGTRFTSLYAAMNGDLGISTNIGGKYAFHTLPNKTGTIALISDLPTASKNVNGWWRCATTGVIFQWGVYSGGENPANITFPTRFPSACRSVQLTVNNNATNSQHNPRAVSSTVTGFTLATGSAERPTYWFAVGY